MKRINLAPMTIILGASMSLAACDSEAPEPDALRATTILTTASDVIAATADDGVMVLDVSDDDAVYEFELGTDPAVWDDVMVDDGVERIPFSQVVAVAHEATGVDAWQMGRFSWTVNAENFGTLNDAQVEKLDSDGRLLTDAGQGGISLRMGQLLYGVYSCGSDIWIICFPEI